jgi:hypothetical protein
VKILTLWGIRRGFEEDMPELMEAWDEHSIDNWVEGWEEACDKARASWGDDLVAWRILELDVTNESILAPFAPARIEARASSQERES